MILKISKVGLTRTPFIFPLRLCVFAVNFFMFLKCWCRGVECFPWILQIQNQFIFNNFKPQSYAKDRLNKNALTSLANYSGQICPIRDRRDGQAVGRLVLRRKGSVISPWLRDSVVKKKSKKSEALWAQRIGDGWSHFRIVTWQSKVSHS